MDDDIDLSDPALASAYCTACGHARAIVDAGKHSLIGGYWTARKTPVERGAMIAAIAEKMRVGVGMGYRDVPRSIIALAVDDVLKGRGPVV